MRSTHTSLRGMKVAHPLTIHEVHANAADGAEQTHADARDGAAAMWVATGHRRLPSDSSPSRAGGCDRLRLQMPDTSGASAEPNPNGAPTA